MNTDSSPNYSSIYLCYSIRVYWMYAAWLQMFWRDGKMTRNSGRSHLSCFRTLHLSSTSASTANANSLYVLLGRNTEKISHNRGFFFFHFCTRMTTQAFVPPWNAAVLACSEYIWFGVMTGTRARKALQSVDVCSISWRFCRKPWKIKKNVSWLTPWRALSVPIDQRGIWKRQRRQGPG